MFAKRNNYLVNTVQVDSKIKEQDLIRGSDLEDIKNSFDLIKCVENEDERGCFVAYIFRKRILKDKNNTTQGDR
ncbi:hypothetical protein [Alkaliphilus sp. B6464]|uniref:hypothetical protein n=1 Tax=Alkaliphilus sp. B6464 TaxID=2731219 RepID=UPI002012C950|nr:hypothetical protein [Alkaliphilus sp. B6464]